MKLLMSGVYMIQCIVNSKCYVGSAKSFRKRWREHRRALVSGNHHSCLLQNAWNKYGEDAFNWIIIERCLPESCVEREQHWLDHYESYNPRRGYNICELAGSTLGLKYTEDQRRRLSEIHRKRLSDPKERAKMSERNKKFWKNQEKRQAKSELMKEMWQDPAYHDMQSKSHEGKAPPRSATVNAAKVNRGRKDSPEVLAKKSAAQMGHEVSEETRAKISASLTGKKQSEETKSKRSLSNKGKKRTLEQRQNISDGRKKAKLARMGVGWNITKPD